MREILGPLLKFLLRPAAIGALYMLALVTRAATRPAAEEQLLGNQAREVTAFIHDRFGFEVARMTVAILFAAIALGAALGIVSGGLVGLRDRMARRPLRGPVSRALAALLVVIGLEGWLVLHGMATSPQLYADGWYAEGGLLRTVQVVVTDVLGPTGVTALGFFVLAVYLAGPVASWKHWPRRLSRVMLPRGKKSLAGTASAAVMLLAIGLLVTLLGTSDLPAVKVAHAGSAPGPMNVIILAADSLRADHLTPELTPRLWELASRGARFDKAYVSLPRTFPSWVTLLTGRHPHHHGIRSMFPRWEERAKDFDALPARLASAGYESTVVSDYAGDIFGRVDLGWTTVDAPGFDFKQLIRQRALERQTPLLPVLHSRLGRLMFPVLRELNDAADPEMVARDAIGAIRHANGKPLFLTVFFSTAHFPYAAPAPFYSRYTDPAYRGRFKYHKPVGLGQEAPPDPADVAQIRGLYKGAVASIDAAAGQILDHLKSEGLEGKTVIIVTSDHGETLYEDAHGQGHGDHLFGDQGVHVPLIVVDPRKKAAPASAQIVRDVDLAPTLYALTGVTPPGDLDGRSLVPALDGTALPPALAYAETGLWFTEEIPGLSRSLRLAYPTIARLTEIDPAHGDEIVLQRAMRPLTVVAKHRMVRDERWKLVYAPTRLGVKFLLYDTERDPGETHDVSADQPAETARLRSDLFAWMVRDREMQMQGEFLVPRDAASMGAWSTPSVSAIRLPGAPASTSTTGSRASSPPMGAP